MSQSAIDYLDLEINRRLSEADALVAKVEEEGRTLAEEERQKIQALRDEVVELKGRKQDYEANEQLKDSIEKLRGPLKTPEQGPTNTSSIGEAFVKSDAYRALQASGLRGGRWTTGPVELPDIQAATVTETASPIVQPTVRPGILEILAQPPRIADLIPSGTTDSNTVRYLQETTATNAAAAVAEGAAKPESTLIFAQVDEPVRKIATFLPVSDEMLEDVSQIRSYLDGRLRLFVEKAEDQQLYDGDGTAPNLSGFLDRSGIQTQAMGADSPVDAIFKAMTKVRNTFLEPDGIVINPADWEQIRLAKDTNQQYYGGGPFTGAYGTGGGMAPNNLWGLPVVVTSAATAGTALVGAFRTASQLFRKTGLTVEASNSHSDFFAKNLTAIRAEIRLALAVFRPASFCTVTGI